MLIPIYHYILFIIIIIQYPYDLFQDSNLKRIKTLKDEDVVEAMQEIWVLEKKKEN